MGLRPYAPSPGAHAQSPQRGRGLGRGVAPFPPPAHLALGAGPLRVPGTSLSLANRGTPGPGRSAGSRTPWLCFKLVGQGDSGQQQAVHWHRVRAGELWAAPPWPGPPGGRVVHAPGGGGGQGGLSTAGASATPPPLRPASQAGSESVSLRSQTHF